MGDDGGNGVLLAVERAGAQKRLVHLYRHGRMLHNSPFGRQIPAQNGDGPLISDWGVKRTNDIFFFDPCLFKIFRAFFVIAAGLQPVQVLAQRFSSDGHHIEVEQVTHLFHDGGHAARIIDIF